MQLINFSGRHMWRDVWNSLVGSSYGDTGILNNNIVSLPRMLHDIPKDDNMQIMLSIFTGLEDTFEFVLDDFPEPAKKRPVKERVRISTRDHHTLVNLSDDSQHVSDVRKIQVSQMINRQLSNERSCVWIFWFKSGLWISIYNVAMIK